MLHKTKLQDILFIDIETVPEFESYEQLNPVRQKLWSEKTAYRRKKETETAKETTPEMYYEKAGIWAEFGKIVCISVGFFNHNLEKERSFRIKSYFGKDELNILTSFKDLLDNYYNKTNQLLCGHNIKEFDIPYLARRLIIHQMSLPSKLQLFGKKPWEVPHLDTLELWKFGDYKHYTSLKLLTEILGIPSPKDDIDGSQVRNVYYKEKDLHRIVKYCEKDVIAVAKVFLRLTGRSLLQEHEIVQIS